MSIGDSEGVIADEQVILQKFEGDPLPENEFERLVVLNGDVVSHQLIEGGEVVGDVPDSPLLGKNIGTFIKPDKEVDENGSS